MKRTYLCTLDFPCPYKAEQSDSCMNTQVDNKCGFREKNSVRECCDDKNKIMVLKNKNEEE